MFQEKETSWKEANVLLNVMLPKIKMLFTKKDRGKNGVTVKKNRLLAAL